MGSGSSAEENDKWEALKAGDETIAKQLAKKKKKKKNVYYGK